MKSGAKECIEQQLQHTNVEFVALGRIKMFMEIYAHNIATLMFAISFNISVFHKTLLPVLPSTSMSVLVC